MAHLASPMQTRQALQQQMQLLRPVSQLPVMQQDQCRFWKVMPNAQLFLLLLHHLLLHHPQPPLLLLLLLHPLLQRRLQVQALPPPALALLLALPLTLMRPLAFLILHPM